MSRIMRFARFVRGQKGLTPAKALSFFYHLPNLIRLSVRLLKDVRVPTRLKVYCGLAVLYLVSPVDLIPEFLAPFLGPLVGLDDVSLVFLAFQKLIKDSPPQIVDEHVRAMSRPAPHSAPQEP